MQYRRLSHDKIHYVTSVVRRGSKKLRIITPRMVECVLRHPPNRPPRITKEEENKINGKLIVPLHPETILQILEVAQNYDKLIVRSKLITSNDESNSTHNSSFDRVAV